MDNKALWVKDTVERVFWTVVELVVGAALAAATVAISEAITDGSVNLEEARGVLVAAWAAGAAALKAWVARLVPGTVSPASTVKP